MSERIAEYKDKDGKGERNSQRMTKMCILGVICLIPRVLFSLALF